MHPRSLRRGLRTEAIQAFELARAHATPGEPLIGQLTEHLQRLARCHPGGTKAGWKPALPAKLINNE